MRENGRSFAGTVETVLKVLDTKRRRRHNSGKRESIRRPCRRCDLLDV